MLHGSLVEILFEVAELKQQRNWRRVTNEMNCIDVAGNVCISLKLTGGPTFSELDYAGMISSQKDVSILCDASH